MTGIATRSAMIRRTTCLIDAGASTKFRARCRASCQTRDTSIDSLDTHRARIQASSPRREVVAGIHRVMNANASDAQCGH
jgi:hypothetical protein